MGNRRGTVNVSRGMCCDCLGSRLGGVVLVSLLRVLTLCFCCYLSLGVLCVVAQESSPESPGEPTAPAATAPDSAAAGGPTISLSSLPLSSLPLSRFRRVIRRNCKPASISFAASDSSWKRRSAISERSTFATSIWRNSHRNDGRPTLSSAIRFATFWTRPTRPHCRSCKSASTRSREPS